MPAARAWTPRRPAAQSAGYRLMKNFAHIWYGTSSGDRQGEAAARSRRGGCRPHPTGHVHSAGCKRGMMFRQKAFRPRQSTNRPQGGMRNVRGEQGVRHGKTGLLPPSGNAGESRSGQGVRDAQAAVLHEGGAVEAGGAVGGQMGDEDQMQALGGQLVEQGEILAAAALVEA